MAAPAVVHELVARFADNRETYHSGQYNEAQLRQEFLNPFFEALGWDVYNTKGYADEDLAVDDCRIRPVKTDKPSTARILFCTFQEYVARWDELEGLLSPEAIRRGVLDRFVTSQKVKKGTAEVDVAFLTEIESWRNLLARNTAARNPDISQRDLNFAVPRTIDRLVFLRICEDRGIELYGTLQALSNGTGVYRRLTELFQRADERYNSGLFHFSPEQDRDEPPDECTLGLTIDDRPLKDLIGSLYYPESPYEFSVLPPLVRPCLPPRPVQQTQVLTQAHRQKPLVRSPPAGFCGDRIFPLGLQLHGTEPAVPATRRGAVPIAASLGLGPGT